MRAADDFAIRAWAEDRMIWLELDDGRQVGFPAKKFPRLNGATDAQLADVQVQARGQALRWEEIDEDLTVADILAGRG
ncbi:MAG TPA: DUF2442 domain-containing protein [Phycisphaerae bacterium]|nr:DUF2442 domain-containing protein [Phycisphaerae bacterium]